MITKPAIGTSVITCQMAFSADVDWACPCGHLLDISGDADDKKGYPLHHSAAQFGHKSLNGKGDTFGALTPICKRRIPHSRR